VAPDDLDAPFWAGCLERRFLLHRCAECGRAYWPASTCIDHGAAPMRWEPSNGRGEVHTYTIVHHAYSRDLLDRVPYALAVVRLDEGPFFHSDLVDCDLDDVHVGMRVRVTFDAIDDETVIPRFVPDTETDSV
jgi:hypothetical protein